MPVMDGLTAVEHIMAECPTPILVLTADPRHQAPELTCRALELGALALQVKPSIDAGPEAWNLAREVKLLSSVRVIRHLRGPQARRRRPRRGEAARRRVLPRRRWAWWRWPAPRAGRRSSTRCCRSCRRTSRRPSSSSSTSTPPSPSRWRAGWRNSSKLKVRLAKDGELLMPGQVLIAPPGSTWSSPSAAGWRSAGRGAGRAHALGHGAAGERGQGLRAAHGGGHPHRHGRGRGGRACWPSSRPAA